MRTVHPEKPFCIGCELAELGQFPWQVSLQTRPPSPPYSSHFCGGAILNTLFVNTAAHCKPTTQFQILAGTLDASSEGQRHIGEAFIQHPGWNANLIINDYAVVKSRDPFAFNEYIQVILDIAFAEKSF